MNGISLAGIACCNEIPIATFATLAQIPLDELRAKLDGALSVKAEIGARLIVEHFPSRKSTSGFAWATDASGARKSGANFRPPTNEKTTPATPTPASFVPIEKTDEEILAILRAMDPRASEEKLQECLRLARIAHHPQRTPLPVVKPLHKQYTAQFTACLPNGEWRFNAGFTATVKGANSAGVRAFEGVAYGGGIVTDHPLYDRVAFDLATTTLQTPAPALYMHRDPVGTVDAAKIGGRIEIEGRLFADADAQAAKVAAMADAGMPWQMSVGIWPGRVEEIGEGKTVILNGQTMTGPLTIYRDSRVREVSFCPLGADSTTVAKVA